MSEAAEMIQRAKEIHQRLLFPPNAVPDAGIDLKRKLIPPETPPTPTTEENDGVLEYPAAGCNVIITSSPPPEEIKTLKINPILRAVSAHYGVTIPEIKSNIRNIRCVTPRHVAYFIAARQSGLSIAAIGRRFGKDHTTILHAVRKMRELLLIDKELAETIEMLEAKLFAGIYDDKPDQHRLALATKSEPNLAQPWKVSVPKS